MSLLLVVSPITVLANNSQGKDLQEQGTTEPTQTTGAIQVDSETAKRLGIKVEPVTRQPLAVGIKTTGQIETLPNQKVDVTAPINGTVVELLVKPGALVTKGQTVAVLSSPELAQLRIDSVQKRAEAEPNLQQAQADLQLAQANLERQRQLVAADIRQAHSQLALAQERYDRDKELVAAGAIPRRQAQEDATKLAEVQALVAKAESRLPVLEAQAQLKRAQAVVEAAQSRIRLSSAAYQARLQQLATRANAKGLVTVTAPISGIVANRQITPGETVTVEAGSKPLMTIVNDNRVWATANIYEKDLDKVESGQQVRVKVTSLPNRIFEGRITFIGAVVEGATRVVPVKAELDNSNQLLKPGMFASLEILTDRTPIAVLAIPSMAVVESDGKQIVFVQEANAYRPVEVTLGRTSGSLVEVKSGLVDGERVVTEGATLLYAKSQGGSGIPTDNDDKPATGSGGSSSSKMQFPWWLVLPIGGALAGAFWLGRRTQPRVESPYGSETEVSILPEEGGAVHPVKDSPDAPNSYVSQRNDSHRPHQD